MRKLPPFEQEHLEAIARALGDTATGLTGSEIEHTLAKCGVEDVDPKNTKWKRLHNALAEAQNTRQFGNHVVAFINKAMKPVNWAGARPAFEEKRAELNTVLAFSGLEVRESGEVGFAKKADTLREAEARAGRLRAKLTEREVHEDVLRFCKAEFLQEDYFHAVLEATKSVADKIRSITGLTSDGANSRPELFRWAGLVLP